MAKKQRGYIRRLNRLNKELEEDNSLLLVTLYHRAVRGEQLASSLSSIRNRIRRLDYSYLVNLEQLGVRSYSITTADIKRQMIEEFLHNEQFLDMIKLEVDDTFHGVGTRYHLSIEVLTPEN